MIFSPLIPFLAFYVRRSSASVLKNEGQETCTAVLVAKQGEKKTIDVRLACFLLNDISYDVEIDDSFVQKNFINGPYKSGETEFDIPPSANIDKNIGKLIVPDKSGIVLRKKESSGKASSNKNSLTRSVLVVRVVATNDAMSETVEFLSDSVFGTDDDPVNLKSQTNLCSHGALNYRYADARSSVDTRPGIENGATTVTVNLDTSAGDGAMRQAVTDELYNQFGIASTSLADNVMLCMPPNTIPYIAYAYINWYLSVYSDRWCTYPSAQMHEIGHNLGLSHTGEGNDEYGNQSGMMGYSYSTDDGPEMCYGAPQAWDLDWYPTKRIEISDSNPTYIGDLAGYIEDVNDDTVPPMLVKIDVDGTSVDYYLYFNRASGFNSGTVEGANQVLISRWDSGGYNNSLLQTRLGAGGSWNIPGYPEGRVVVNSIGIRASVSIYLTPIIDSSEVPSSMPSDAPSSLPSEVPSSMPSDDPSSLQSEVPSSMPSDAPLSHSSEVPSSTPSSAPSPASTLPCYDARLPLSYNGNTYSCAQLSSGGGCTNVVVQSHCPLSCNACLEYKCKNSEAPFNTPLGVKRCTDLQNLPDEYCDFPQLFTTCRQTCEICDA